MIRIAYNDCVNCGKDGDISIVDKKNIESINMLRVDYQCSNCGKSSTLYADMGCNDINDVELYDVALHDAVVASYKHIN